MRVMIAFLVRDRVKVRVVVTLSLEQLSQEQMWYIPKINLSINLLNCLQKI